MYFFSNSPVRCRLTNVVCRALSVIVAPIENGGHTTDLASATIAHEHQLKGRVLALGLAFSHGALGSVAMTWNLSASVELEQQSPAVEERVEAEEVVRLVEWVGEEALIVKIGDRQTTSKINVGESRVASAPSHVLPSFLESGFTCNPL